MQSNYRHLCQDTGSGNTLRILGEPRKDNFQRVCGNCEKCSKLSKGQGASLGRSTNATTEPALRNLRDLPLICQVAEASEWPDFDDEGWYVGPLSSCDHYHNQPLQGLEVDQWRTGPSAAYPSAFCYYLAQLCLGAVVTAPQLADTGDMGRVDHEAERYAMQELATGKPVTRTAVSTLFSLLLMKLCIPYMILPCAVNVFCLRHFT